MKFNEVKRIIDNISSEFPFTYSFWEIEKLLKIQGFNIKKIYRYGFQNFYQYGLVPYYMRKLRITVIEENGNEKKYTIGLKNIEDFKNSLLKMIYSKPLKIYKCSQKVDMK